ncbi:phosphoribosyltransferase family protein [Planomicrobium sp. Y74]|uniref:ComF family protein n=1 Tax=Planomicrobium sp. Y74 TaxID=2478977 RepID=UPI002570D6EE|nr:phosphoribosyltransferase family protein [Planomicrobium sp. Y74]
MKCYLCADLLDLKPSWRDLFFMDREETVCLNCRATFERLIQGCKICSASGPGICEECNRWETTELRRTIDSGQCLYAYNNAMKDYFHQFKFLQDVVLAEVFSEELVKAVRKTKGVAVPIPMNPVKLRKRTFAQVDSMLEAGGADYVHLLQKNEEIQGEKTKEERISTRGIFTWNGNSVPKNIVLVDDMYTTGTTLRLAAEILKEAGAETVTFVALIRA